MGGKILKIFARVPSPPCCIAFSFFDSGAHPLINRRSKCSTFLRGLENDEGAGAIEVWVGFGV